MDGWVGMRSSKWIFLQQGAVRVDKRWLKASRWTYACSLAFRQMLNMRCDTCGYYGIVLPFTQRHKGWRGSSCSSWSEIIEICSDLQDAHFCANGNWHYSAICSRGFSFLSEISNYLPAIRQFKSIVLHLFTLTRSQLTLRWRLRGWQRLPVISQTAHCRHQTHRRRWSESIKVAQLQQFMPTRSSETSRKTSFCC